jgi:hypothetical protein
MSQITHFWGQFMTSKLSSRKKYNFSHVCSFCWQDGGKCWILRNPVDIQPMLTVDLERLTVVVIMKEKCWQPRRGKCNCVMMDDKRWRINGTKNELILCTAQNDCGTVCKIIIHFRNYETSERVNDTKLNCIFIKMQTS